MKSVMNKILSLSIIAAFAYTAAPAQEYDFMYFTPKDRKTVKLEENKIGDKPASLSTTYEAIEEDPQENYSSKNVNPEYIAKYKSPDSQTAIAQNNAPAANNYSSDDYYVEDYNGAQNGATMNNQGHETIISNSYTTRNIVRNSYYDGWNNPYAWNNMYGAWNNPWNSPYGWNNWANPNFGWGSPGWNFGYNFGYGWGAPYSAFSVSYSWGNAWGPGFWNDPFYSPWHNPFWRRPAGFGFYSAYNWGFRNGFHYGNNFYNPNYYNVYENASRNVQYRAKNSRSSGNYRNVGRSYNNERRSDYTYTRNRSTEGRSYSQTNGRRVSSERDFTNTQNEYYRRSRSNDNSTVNRRSSSSRINTINNSRNTQYSRSNRSTYNNRSTMTNDRPSRYSNNSRSNNRSTYTRPSSGSNSRSTYQRSSTPSRSRSSFSTPSRSRSSGSSFQRSSSPSRSSAPSRSSGSSGSRSRGRQ